MNCPEAKVNTENKSKKHPAIEYWPSFIYSLMIQHLDYIEK